MRPSGDAVTVLWPVHAPRRLSLCMRSSVHSYALTGEGCRVPLVTAIQGGIPAGWDVLSAFATERRHGDGSVARGPPQRLHLCLRSGAFLTFLWGVGVHRVGGGGAEHRVVSTTEHPCYPHGSQRTSPNPIYFPASGCFCHSLGVMVSGQWHQFRAAEGQR